MRYDEALAHLDAHLNREAVAGRYAGLSLDPIASLLAAMGDPHEAYPVIHVTGTNGKGSTAQLISAALEAHGLTVGLYTSPHYERVNERIARNREPVGDDELGEAIGAVAAAEQVAGVSSSYFEILTAAAFGWFAEVAVDVAVVEVGLLGAFDATNVVSADVAVVTNVGRDHTDGVGEWRRAIATEKAGIIEPTSHLVLGPVGGDVADVFLERPARDRWRVGTELLLDENLLAVGGRSVDLRTPHGSHREVFVPLHGEHQAMNALVALGAVEAFFDRPVDTDVLRAAWADVALPGRFEVVARRPMVVLDGAHNPEGMAALRATVDELSPGGRRIVVLGVLEGRDPGEMIDELGLTPADLVFACRPASDRALDPDTIVDAALQRGVGAVAVATVAEALDRARDLAGEDDLVLVTGSIYTVGEARPLTTG